MEIYLVGGAIRDKLLGLKPKDKDWVVIGTTEKIMLSKGFKKVPASFPVFIHPKTKQEYALARSEKKISSGYHGFEVNFSPEITLEEDLKRRDLTINSIAQDSNKKIIDPFNGQKDIEDRILRHTSLAFAEDPLRAVRLARFKAQLFDFNFSIASETKELVQKISESGELSTLKKERLHTEFIKSLKNPYIFFKTLDQLNILNEVFLDIKVNLEKIPKINFFKNDAYQNLNNDEKVTMCFLEFNNNTLNKIKANLNLTNKQYSLLKATQTIYQICKNNLSPKEIFKLIKQANILRNKQLYQDACLTFKAYISISESQQLIQKFLVFKEIIKRLLNLDIQKLIANTPKTQLGQALEKLQIDTINKLIKV